MTQINYVLVLSFVEHPKIIRFGSLIVIEIESSLLPDLFEFNLGLLHVFVCGEGEEDPYVPLPN